MKEKSVRGKVLFLTTEFPPDPGGIGTYIYQNALWLHRLGWEVCVIAKQGVVTAAVTIDNFNRAQPFQIITTTTLNRRLFWRTVQKFRPDILLSGDLISTWLGWQVSILARVPLVAFAIGSEFRHSSFWRLQLKRMIYGTCLYVVAISHFTLRLMQKVHIAPRGSCVIYPGGNPEIGQLITPVETLRERYQVHGKRIILTVGSLSPRKGQDVIIRALPKVLQRHPDVHYVAAGKDRTDGEFARLVSELNLHHAVTFTGVIDEQEKSAFYHLSEFCALTSRNLADEVEGFGIVVLEAALCGRTTIGTFGTGVEETLIDGVSGVLVSQHDIEATADAVMRLLDDKSLRQRLEQEAYRQAVKHGTWEARSHELDRLLIRLLRQ